MTKSRPYRRRYDRIFVPMGHTIRCSGTQQKLEGTVHTLGQGGMFVKTKNYYPHGTMLDLRVEDRTTEFHARCAVRSVVPEGLGLEFIMISSSDLEQLKDLIIHLRSRHALPA